MNAAKVAEVKAAHVANAHRDVESRGQARGLGPAEVKILKEAVKPPLAAFTDGYSVHFFGPDAAAAAKVLATKTDTKDGQPYLEIDSRNWNDLLLDLQIAGFEVAISAAE